MDIFQKLFGIKSTQVKRNCIIMPCFTKGMATALKIRVFQKGRLYTTGNSPEYTCIHSGMGAGFVGDAVLYLKDTGCKNIVLFGSCGALFSSLDLTIGAVVAPVNSYSYESFSMMLGTSQSPAARFFAHPVLLNRLIKIHRHYGISIVTAATVASLKREEAYAVLLRKHKVAVVDMESSAFFAAAQSIRRRAIALFYVSDVVGKKPFYLSLSPVDQVLLDAGRQKAISLLSVIARDVL